MSTVTDANSTRVIFCEGEPGGPDVRLWSRLLIADRHPEAGRFRIKLEPLGGKQAAKNFARGYAQAQGNSNWRVIRDRDLDAEHDDPKTIVRWDGGRVLLTGMTCLESYLVLPDLPQRFIEVYKLEAVPNDHRGILRETVAALRDYQAVRWALQRLRKVVQDEVKAHRLHRTAGQFDLPNRLSEKDGTLPAKLDLASCHDEAQKLVDLFRDTLHTVDRQRLSDAIDRYRARFDGEDFRSDGFRRWYHGKDMLKHWLGKYPNLSQDRYIVWAVEQVDWRQFPDLIELQHVCQTEQGPPA